MASVNKVIIVGNLGRDPETRYMPEGAPSPTSRWPPRTTGRTRTARMQEKTEWHRVAFFGKLAEIAGEYLKKGSQVYVEGRLQTREWEKGRREGYTTEIIANQMQMLGSRQGMGGGAMRIPSAASAGGRSRPASKPAAARPAGASRRHGSRRPVRRTSNFRVSPSSPGCKNCRGSFDNEAHRPVPHHQPRRRCWCSRSRSRSWARTAILTQQRAQRRHARSSSRSSSASRARSSRCCISKPMAKWSTGARVIETPQTPDELWLVDTVKHLAEKAGVGDAGGRDLRGRRPMPSPPAPSATSSLVAVSSGLLESMTPRGGGSGARPRDRRTSPTATW